jgi:crotonobetainyl-CoA:carnitine CoA-transferase CaiB-like acyl-CoA transferase
MKVGVAMADLSTGMYAAVSTLLALRHAEHTGQGQRVDVSLLDTQISMLANQALSFLVGGESPGRLGNAHPTVVPYRTFQAADHPIVVAVGNDAQFRVLCDVIGAPELARDERYATNGARVVNRGTLEPALQEIISKMHAHELLESLHARSVPAGPVNTIGEAFEDPFVEARGTVQRFMRDDGIEVPSVAYPGKFSETPADYRRRPPFLGEHTREVLQEWLGLEAGKLDELTTGGVIAQR